MVNVILLLVNFVALLIAFGERASVHGDGIQWLASVQWDQVGTDFWALTKTDEVNSLAVLAVWLAFTVFWTSATVVDLLVRRRKATASLSDSLSGVRSGEPQFSSENRPQQAKASGGAGQVAPQQATGADGAGLVAGGFAGAMASAQASQANQANRIAASALVDPTLGPLLSDLEQQVSNLPAEAQQEIDQLRRALEALVAKP